MCKRWAQCHVTRSVSSAGARKRLDRDAYGAQGVAAEPQRGAARALRHNSAHVGEIPNAPRLGTPSPRAGPTAARRYSPVARLRAVATSARAASAARRGSSERHRQRVSRSRASLPREAAPREVRKRDASRTLPSASALAASIKIGISCGQRSGSGGGVAPRLRVSARAQTRGRRAAAALAPTLLRQRCCRDSGARRERSAARRVASALRKDTRTRAGVAPIPTPAPPTAA